MVGIDESSAPTSTVALKQNTIFYDSSHNESKEEEEKEEKKTQREHTATAGAAGKFERGLNLSDVNAERITLTPKLLNHKALTSHSVSTGGKCRRPGVVGRILASERAKFSHSPANG